MAGNSLHDLNVSDSMDPDIHGITDMDRDVTERDELDNDDGSTSGGVCSSSVLRTISILMSDPLSCTLSFCSSYLCYFKEILVYVLEFAGLVGLLWIFVVMC